MQRLPARVATPRAIPLPCFAAYPATIYPRDLNPDRTTATTAVINFRMVIDTAAVHGSNLLNLTTIHMGMNIGYSWNVYPLADELKKVKDDPQVTSEEFCATNQSLHSQRSSNSLREAKDNYKPNSIGDGRIRMNGVGGGSFFYQSLLLHIHQNGTLNGNPA